MTDQTDDFAKPVAKALDAVANYKHRELNRSKWLFVAALATTGALLSMVVDWIFVLQLPAARWAGPIIVWSLTAFFALRAYRFFKAGADRNAAARALDKSRKNSLDEWTTFAALQSSTGATGSDSMAKAMIRGMAPMSRYIDPADVDPVPFPRRTFACLVGSLVLFIAFLGAFSTQGSARLPVRFLAPWADLPLTVVKETSAPPEAILRGSDLHITAETGGKSPYRIWLEIDDGSKQSTKTDTPEFALENLQQTLRYRLKAGDGTTEWRKVIVTDPPRLSMVKVTIQDPPYSRRPPKTWNRFPSQTRVIRGSSLLVEFEVDQPVKSAAIALSKPFTRKITLTEHEGRFGYRSQLNSELHFRPEFVSEWGFENKPLPFCEIEVVEDKAPEVRLTGPPNVNLLSPHEDFTINFQAKDDIGIVSAEAVFKITDTEGNTREMTVPIELGEKNGKASFTMKAKLNPGELGITQNDSVDWSVRVFDGSKQSSSKSTNPSQSGSQENTMTMRPLQIGQSAESKSGNIRFSTKELINEVEAKQKKILNIEKAFARLKAFTSEARKYAADATAPEVPPGKTLDTKPLYQAVENARTALQSAENSVSAISDEASGTPYAFLSMQLQSVVRSWLKPADAQLEASVRNRLKDLAPREIHRRQAESMLLQALAQLELLEGKLTKVRSEVKTEIAATEMMNMLVAQVEDTPALLGGDDGTPYQRTPGEISRAQAEAALAKLESLKEIYSKTAELLEQHPELWQRYMDKSQSETSIYRDQLEKLAARHDAVRGITRKYIDGQKPEADLKQLISSHRHGIKSNLVRSLNKAQTWIQTSSIEKPSWLELLEQTTYESIQSEDTSPDAAAKLVKRLNNIARELEMAVSVKPDRSISLRLGEIKNAKEEARLVQELAESLHKEEWTKAAKYEQANIAHRTQQLAGRIEVEGARLNNLSAKVENLGYQLSEAMQSELLPELSNSVYELMDNRHAEAATAQEKGALAFTKCVELLDQYVVAAIAEMDKAPPNAGIGGGPEITATTLEELEQKLQEEKEMSESFGIP